MERIRNYWHQWKIVAEKIGVFQAGIIFSILYYLLITPLGLVSGLFNDYFKKRTPPSWQEFEGNTNSVRKLKEQS